MNPNAFLLLNLAFGFYNAGTIWAHELDIFRSWKLLDPKGFHEVQRVHWHKLPYWIFTPVCLSVLGSIALAYLASARFFSDIDELDITKSRFHTAQEPRKSAQAARPVRPPKRP